MADYQIKNVSQQKIALRIRQIVLSGATKVSMIRESNGTWTISYSTED